MSAAELADALRQVLAPEQVSTGDSDRTLHGEDLSFHPPRLPDVVVFAKRTEDVAQTMRLAHEARVAVVPFGAGSSLEGHTIPARGGISLDLTGLDRILAIRPRELTATVEAGVTRLALERRLAEHGLCFPVDPGADATLGGMAATNAAGTMTARYGKMRPQVLALEAVLPGGDVIRTGSRALKSSAGYDLTGLLVGSEGTLGVITELTVRLRAIPEQTVLLRASFADMEAACAAVGAIVAAAVPVLRMELMDAWEVDAVNRFAGTDLHVGPLLFVELGGAPAAVDGELLDVRAAFDGAGALDVVDERDPTRCRRLWRARHDVLFAEKAMAPGKQSLSTDVCVPVPELAGALALARAAIDDLGLTAGIVAHAADGNVHLGLLVDPDDAREMARAHRLHERLVDDALARGGTCTGEHGIGLGKRRALAREHGDQLALMRAIKRAFDPHDVMNPGKVLPEDAIEEEAP